MAHLVDEQSRVSGDKAVFDRKSADGSGKRTVVLAIALAVSVFLTGFFLVSGIKDESRQIDVYQEKVDRSIQTRSTVWKILHEVQAARNAELESQLNSGTKMPGRYKREARVISLLQQLEALTADTAQSEAAGNLRVPISDMFSGELQSNALPGPDGLLASPRPSFETHYEAVEQIAAGILAEESATVDKLTALERTNRYQLVFSWQLIFLLLAALGFTGSVATAAHVVQSRRVEAGLQSAREAAEKARLEAEKASAAKTSFLASMSHEIRTPLNGVLGYSELLSDTHLDRDQRRYLERIRFTGSALISIVNDILDFSKVEAGRIDIRRQSFSIRALINNTTSIFEDQALQKGLKLTLDLDPGLPEYIVGDEARIRQILLNLLNNALKFTSRGSINLKAAVLEEPGFSRFVRFSVTDTGGGIPASKLDRLFERFHQAHEDSLSRFGGTGLGLAISKRLAEAMDGELGVCSEEGRGSTFWLEIELIEPKQIQSGTSATKPVSPPVHGPKASILVVEDLEFNRELTGAVLASFGHRVEFAENGAEAVEKVRTGSYDLILMDIQMPVMDGLTAARKIRELPPPARETPIIGVTANVLPHQMKMFAEAGMNGHIAKPFKKNELLEKVAICLQRTRMTSPMAIPEPKPDEVETLMGKEWMAKATGELQKRLAEVFTGIPSEAENQQELAQKVHAVISLAGALGLTELAQRCVELEQSSRSGTDLARSYDEARKVAQSLCQTGEHLNL